MRWFAAHREPANAISAPRSGGRFFKAALFAVACLAGVSFSASERFEARAADDGGMMSFLLGGNGAGRIRAATPQFRLDPPALRGLAPVARKVAVSRQKSKAAYANRHVAARNHVKQPRHAVAAPGRGLVQKASYERPVDIADRMTIAQTLAVKAAAAAARPDDSYLKDKTLRRGDIIATAAGLRVFLGSAQFPYRARDFAPISATRHIAQRPVLEALDRSLRGVRLVARSQLQKRVAKVEERLGPGKRLEAGDDVLDRRERQPVLLEQVEPVAHEHVVVGLVAGGAAQRLDAGALGDSDPDLGHQHPLQIEGDDGLDRLGGSGVGHRRNSFAPKPGPAGRQ